MLIRKKFKKGFTLLEMLIVIIILGIIFSSIFYTNTTLNTENKQGFVLLNGNFLEFNKNTKKLYLIKDYNNNGQLDNKDYNNKKEIKRIKKFKNGNFILGLHKIPENHSCFNGDILTLKNEAGIFYCYDKNNKKINGLFDVIEF